MKIIERLLEQTKDIYEKYYNHPFVKGIENGTLDREKFRKYIIQDYLYLIEYTKVFGIGLAKSKSIETMNLFAYYIELIIKYELNIHNGYIGKLNITEEEISNTKRKANNLSYTSYMLRVAYEEGEAETFMAILACAYSYVVIAENIIKNNPNSVNHEFYGEWIKGYASEEYSKDNDNLLNVIDKLIVNYTEEQINHLIDIFVTCSNYELDFWNMAWNIN